MEIDARRILDALPALVWTARPDGRLDFVSRRWCEYTGISSEEAPDWGWQRAFHPEDLAELLERWRALLASGEAGEIEARLRRFDGVCRWFLLRANPLRDDAGNIVKWYGTNTDIDGRKRIEEELRRSEAFLAEAQRLSSTGNFSWCVDTDQTVFSAEFYRILELGAEAPLAIDQIAARVHPEDLPWLVERIAPARDGIEDFSHEIRLLMPDGRVKYLATVAHAIRHQDGRLEYLGTIQDITEHRLAEEALGKLRTELARVTRVTSLGVMAASIAHEVNQPLSGIMTNAGTCLRMLAADPPNVEGAQETARRAIRDANRATEVVARLRALFGRRPAILETVDLNEAAQEVIALIWIDIQRSRVVLRTELADGLPPVGGDRVQLQQVIINLARNALEAMVDVHDRPRELLIKTEHDSDEHVRLTVEDRGVGFGAQGLARLFDPFYTTKRDGMGMGLSVSHSIIQSHHGRLWAELNDGPGVRFAFSLPQRSGNTALQTATIRRSGS